MTIIMKVFVRQKGELGHGRARKIITWPFNSGNNRTYSWTSTHARRLIWRQTRQPVKENPSGKQSKASKDYIIIKEEFLASNATEIVEKHSGSIDTGSGNGIYRFSDGILLGGKHSKMWSKFMRKVKSLKTNNFRVIRVLGIKWLTRD